MGNDFGQILLQLKFAENLVTRILNAVQKLSMEDVYSENVNAMVQSVTLKINGVCEIRNPPQFNENCLATVNICIEDHFSC